MCMLVWSSGAEFQKYQKGDQMTDEFKKLSTK